MNSLATRDKTKKKNRQKQLRKTPCRRRSSSRPCHGFGHATIGNHGVLRRAATGGLAVSRPHDRYEREADRVAGRVMRMPDPASEKDRTRKTMNPLQRAGSRCKQTIRKNKPRKSGEGEQTLQHSESSKDSPTTNRRRSPGGSPAGGGEALPDALRSFFEPRFGEDFSHVRIHKGDEADQTVRSVRADALRLAPTSGSGPGPTTVPTAGAGNGCWRMN